jgi:GT2 family glycosyltransferase
MPIARNTGMKRAQGEIILMLDDDCIAHTDWIAQASRSHMKYPHAWAMQGKVISIPRESIYSLVLQQQRNVRIKMSTLKHGGILYLDTANCSFKRARLLKTNILFYETEKYIGPDVDLTAQIVVKGGFVVFDKSIVVYHQERSSLKSFLLQRYRNGVTPSIMKRRWPQLKFHFYHAAILLHIMNYFALSKYLLKKKRYRDFFILPFILIMAIAAFELAGFIESIQGKKKHL